MWNAQEAQGGRSGGRGAGQRGRVMLCALVLLIAGCGSGASTVRPNGTPTPAPPATTDWPRFGFDAARSGVNPNDAALSPTNVSGLRRLWQVALPNVADSSPMLLHAVRQPNGSTRDMLYVTTLDGRLLALDASDGRQLWAQQPQGQKITNSSPVASADRQYVFAYGLDGFLHKYAAATGKEVTGGGWPVRITTMTGTEKELSALNEANGHVYVTTSGYIGDAPPYQGHVVAVDEQSGATDVFNSLCANVNHLLTQGECSASDSGIWARAGAVVDPTDGDVFVATGNATFDANAGGQDYGDSVLALAGSDLHLLDSWTPATYQQLGQDDADLGSTAPALLPTIVSSTTQYLLVQGGKDALLRLLNRRNLSGQGGPGHVGGELQVLSAPGNCGVYTQPLVWTDPSGAIWVFVASQCAFGAFTVVTSGGVTRLQPAWKLTLSGTTPIMAGGVLFVATSGNLLALDPSSGRQLWASAQSGAGGTIGDIHWESPIAVGSTVYVPDQSGNLTAYGL